MKRNVISFHCLFLKKLKTVISSVGLRRLNQALPLTFFTVPHFEKPFCTRHLKEDEHFCLLKEKKLPFYQLAIILMCDHLQGDVHLFFSFFFGEMRVCRQALEWSGVARHLNRVAHQGGTPRGVANSPDRLPRHNGLVSCGPPPSTVIYRSVAATTASATMPSLPVDLKLPISCKAMHSHTDCGGVSCNLLDALIRPNLLRYFCLIIF